MSSALWRSGLLCLLTGLAAGCASPVQGLFPPPPSQASRTVYVLHRGWHTGVIVRAADIPPGLWPEHRAYPEAEYLEAGWGDSQGYRFPWTSSTVCRAMFYSKASVLLTHGFSGPVPEEYEDVASEIIAVPLSSAGLARLCAYIQDTYALDAQGQPIPQPSLYPEMDFFLARGHYWMFDNCNNWTARALRTAGCPMAPRWSFLPGIVMSQARRFGRVVWREGQSVVPSLQPACHPSEVVANHRQLNRTP